MIGKTISHYHVTGALGAGGMGEVYRATDTRLDRDVALKVLPAGALADEAARKRFRKEALALSKLNHSNIAVVHDFDTQDGIDFLVMEFVEGTTLAGRIVDGALSEKEAAKIGAQVAEALEEAHEQGVVHRDLKPGNVMVTSRGRVKVLDFGLAKLLKTEGPDVSTMSESSSTTVAGTLPYMSPEQLQSEPVDARTDLYALGVVLYETATGRRPFLEDTAPKLTDAILHHEPVTPRALNARVTPEFERIILKSLEKDPDERYQSAKEVAVDLRRLRGSTSDLGIARRHRAAWQRLVPAWVTGLLAIVAAVFLGALWQVTRPKIVQPMRLSVEVPSGEPLVSGGASAVISPDGTRLAFAVGAGSQRRMYIRPLDQLQATEISGTGLVHSPFFSPDGEWIGFFGGFKLKKVSVRGGATVTLTDVRNARGGSWGDDGAIIFAPTPSSGLSRVPSAGGTPEVVTTLDEERSETSHRWPQVLPGGKAVLFTVLASSVGEPYIEVQSLETGERKTLQQGGIYGRYLPTGHLAYVREGTLFAAPFDLGRLEVTGPSAPIVEDVQTTPSVSSAQFDFSQTGTLVYVHGGETGNEVSIFWMDRKGKTEPLLSAPRDYLDPRFSPDGRRLAVAIEEDGNRDIWIYERERDILSRLTFEAGTDRRPLWTPDGKRVTFASGRDGAQNIYWKRADGTGEVERLTESKNFQYPRSWSPDGKVLAFHELSTETSWDLWTIPMEEDGAGEVKPGNPVPFLRTPFFETYPTFSPDGRWLAHISNESGRFEVYVRPFPGPGGKWQVSPGGGGFPIWSGNGRELFYRTPDRSQIMVVSYSVEGDSFRAGSPRLWSEGRSARGGQGPNFALHPDGKRFAVLKETEESEETRPTHVTFVLNWFDEVRRRVAAAGQN